MTFDHHRLDLTHSYGCLKNLNVTRVSTLYLLDYTVVIVDAVMEEIGSNYKCKRSRNHFENWKDQNGHTMCHRRVRMI